MSRLFANALCSSGVLLLCLELSAARGTDPPAVSKQLASKQPSAVNFAKEVFPILQRSCIECHGAKKQSGDLRLDQREAALQSGLIELGQEQLNNLETSELLRRVSLPRGDEEVMPAIGEPLSKAEIAVLRKWIEQGAPWPEDFAATGHWSYRTPQRPVLPSAPEIASANLDWSKSPIDQLVLKRLIDEGLEPSPRATGEKLVRRLFLDLIGLPPTPAEVQAYLDEPTDEHYEELVEDLLRRPQFGERWARPWLDLARYADSHGFQRDDFRDLWAYRDWVIRALNDDMPFDQFTIEQIAGDLLPQATESQKIATGFHRCAPTNCEAGSLPEETRIEQVIDRVNTTGAVWLGTTLECCQCHDHKYDPFSMKEYYQLLAFYNNTELEADRTDPKTPSSIQFKGPQMALANADRDAKLAELNSQLSAIELQLKDRRSALESTLVDWSQRLTQSGADRPQSHGLEILDFQSMGTTDSFKKLADGSVLLVGDDPPDKDIYRIRVRASLKDIRAFRLDALQHDSLPGKGPGRGDPKRRNFVLNDFAVDFIARPNANSPDIISQATPARLAFQSASASFSQAKWDVAGAVDNQAKTGWAISPQFDRPHWATFVLSQPLDLSNDDELLFTLTQEFGQARTLGCLRLTAITGNIDAEAVSSEIVSILGKPAANWSIEERKKLLDYRVMEDKQCLKLKRELAKLQKQITELAPDTTLLMVELDSPRMSNLFIRGDYKQPGDRVQPSVPAVLHTLPDGPLNRLTLARWLVSTQNPLVARVTVNRWWAELFGQGIVATPEDFGIKGEAPSHPELLDWLSVEFMEHGWSMKHVLKTIVMSATYQQTSRITPELHERDDRNRLLARGPRFRLDAEMVRDNALAISGLLDLRQFGPSIRPYQPDGIWTKVGGARYEYEVSPGSEQHRRGIYVVLKRGAPYPSFVNFDATARLACTVKRTRTNTPLQALTLLNDPVYSEASKALAARIQTEMPQSTVDAQITFAFQLCVARSPSDAERSTIRNLLEAQTAATNLDDAWFSVATMLLNLHETITKD